MIDIFVSKEIAQKLRKIGFDEPCIAIYSIHDNELKGIIQGEEKLIDNFILGKFTCSSYSGIPAPTYGQAFKWFRERNCLGYIKYYSDVEKYACFIYLKNKAYCPEIIGFYETYEESRDELILKLIELYQNNKKWKY